MDVRSRCNHGFSPKNGAEELMKAIVFNMHGAPDVLKYTDSPDPAIRPNEVLFRVKACALNHLDLWVRQGIPGLPIPLPHTPLTHISPQITHTSPHLSTLPSP